MARTGNFMGSTKAAILAFFTNLSNNGLPFAVQLGTTADAFPAFVARVTAALSAQTDADAAIAAAQAATATANGLIDALQTEVRDMATSGRASTMTDGDLATLGIVRRAATSSPIPAPTIAPALVVQSMSAGVAVVGFSTPGSSSPRARAVGSVGVVISLRTAGSTIPAESGVIQQFSRTPAQVDTSLLAAGPLKMVGCFVTATGLRGPWSDVINFTSQPV